MRYLFVIFLSFSLHAIELSPSDVNASVYFISPNDGETVSRRFTVRFGLENFGIAPAGIEMVNTGHHHLIIDAICHHLTYQYLLIRIMSILVKVRLKLRSN